MADSSKVSADNNEMILYMHPSSYFSKIALLAFHEKGLKYTPHFVNIFKRENLHPWYLKLNPKGQLPVLQDGEHVIPGSDFIIQYLEDKFCNETIPKLHPPEGTDTNKRVKSVVQLLRTFQNHVLTYGIFNFPELFTGYSMKEYERKARLDLLHNGEHIMDEIQQQFPEMRKFLNEKKAAFRARYEDCKDIDGIEKGKKQTESILDKIETELGSHKQDSQQWWLCCEDFTEADATLAIFLLRLDELGMISQFIEERPLLQKYWQQLAERTTFKAFLEDLEKMHQKMSDA